MHRPIRSSSVLLFFCLALGPARLLAQFDPEPTTGFHPALDTVLVSVHYHPTWQGFLLGTLGGSTFADFAIAGAPAVAGSGLGLTARVAAMGVVDDRADAVHTGEIRGGVSFGWWFDPGQIELTLDGYGLRRDGENTGVELGIRVTGFDIPWGLEERNPTLAVAVYRDIGTFETWRGVADFDFGLWIQNAAMLGGRETGAFVEGQFAWAEDWAGWDTATHGALDQTAWRLGLMAAIDKGLAAYFVRVGAADPRNAGAKAYAEFTVRFYPDAR